MPVSKYWYQVSRTYPPEEALVLCCVPRRKVPSRHGPDVALASCAAQVRQRAAQKTAMSGYQCSSLCNALCNAPCNALRNAQVRQRAAQKTAMSGDQWWLSYGHQNKSGGKAREKAKWKARALVVSSKY